MLHAIFQILNVKNTTMIVLLKTNDLSLCLNREYSKSVLQKNILK